MDRTHAIARGATLAASGLLGLLLAAGLAPPALAGGLYVSDFGTPTMATAGAGALALGMDASTAIQNPAAMTRLDRHQAMAALAPGVSSIKFDSADDSPGLGNNGGNQGGFVPLISSSYVHKLTDRARLGIGLVSISGAALDPHSDWAGRNQITGLSLFTLTFFPSAAFRVTDWLSLGAGIPITYGTLDWKLKVDPPGPRGEETLKLDDFDDVAPAALVSALIEPTPDLRFGIAYQSETKLKLDGDIKLPIGVAANTELQLPLAQAVRFDLYWQATDDLALMLGADWEDWSTAKTVPLSTAQGSTKVPLGMKDTWKLRGGVHYRVDARWLLQAGASYDSAPLQTSDRIAALPLDRQLRVGFGALHDWTENTRIGMAFEWVNLGDGNIDNTAPGTGIKGDYKRNDLFFLVLNFNFANLPWSGRGTF